MCAGIDEYRDCYNRSLAKEILTGPDEMMQMKKSEFSATQAFSSNGFCWRHVAGKNYTEELLCCIFFVKRPTFVTLKWQQLQQLPSKANKDTQA